MLLLTCPVTSAGCAALIIHTLNPADGEGAKAPAHPVPGAALVLALVVGGLIVAGG